MKEKKNPSIPRLQNDLQRKYTLDLSANTYFASIFRIRFFSLSKPIVVSVVVAAFFIYFHLFLWNGIFCVYNFILCTVLNLNGFLCIFFSSFRHFFFEFFLPSDSSISENKYYPFGQVKKAHILDRLLSIRCFLCFFLERSARTYIYLLVGFKIH